jgi:hypothetical protein
MPVRGALVSFRGKIAAEPVTPGTMITDSRSE